MSASLKINNFRKLAAQAKEFAARRDYELAELTVKAAKPLCPVSDNNEAGHVHLRDTIRVVKNKTGGASAVAGDESKGVDHALFVHEGTHLMEGTPFLREGSKLAIKRTNNRNVKMYRG